MKLFKINGNPSLVQRFYIIVVVVMGFMIYAWCFNKRSEIIFRNPDELRITLGKITKCYPKFDDDVYHGHYYVNGEKFKFGSKFNSE